LPDHQGDAPGWPGLPAMWTTGAKVGAGTALSPMSRVWFTLSGGIMTEVYHPRMDRACIRDMELLVTNGADFFSEEKLHTRHRLETAADGVPAYRLINECDRGRFRIEKEIATDPARDTILQRTRFIPLDGRPESYRLHALLTPRLGNRGSGNTAWVGDFKGVPMLFAERGENAISLACSAGWKRRSVGFVGVSDGWQDLSRHREMRWHYNRVTDGNVALTGEIDWSSSGGAFLLVVGFGRTPSEAGHAAIASLLAGFEPCWAAYVREWTLWQDGLLAIPPSGRRDLYRTSAAVIRTHETKHCPGGIIASLSIPWGFARGDDEIGGYHLVWPRDLSNAAGALLAAGANEDVRRLLHCLQASQEADGHWPQAMWIDGSSYWSGVQMDETALPVLMVDLARRQGAIQDADLPQFWPMVRKAAGFIARHGPATPQDRWEEQSGFAPCTIASEIAALLASAEWADLQGEPQIAEFLRQTADCWNDSIERWTYVTDSALARSVGVDGLYVRVTPGDAVECGFPSDGMLPNKNREGGGFSRAGDVVSPDALALVRFGLRAPDDPRILNTVRVIDAVLKVETPFGPAWRRYNGDGYGEKEDGNPFAGTGIGRPWPLLTAERGLYELAAGRKLAAVDLMLTMEAFANEGRMIPEQIWDGPERPDHLLQFGRPSGSAAPLVWAHAEYVKLRRSLEDGRVFDMPPQTARRYLIDKTTSRHFVWRFTLKSRTIPRGKLLRLQVSEPAEARWSSDGWRTVEVTESCDTGLGVHIVDLPTEHLASGSRVDFTFFWMLAERWEQADFSVTVE